MEVNWAKEWADRLAQTSHRSKLGKLGIADEDFWSGYRHLEHVQQYSDYPGKMLERVMESVDAQSTVLDVGAGGGAFAVPLAGVAGRVTAVEPSPGQIARLKESAEKAGITNIRMVQKRWEDVDLREVGRHQVVLAANSLSMDDIRAALQKLCDAAERHLFVVHIVDHDLEPVLRDLIGGRERPDYIYPYNVLYGMGYRPDVEIVGRRYEIPLDLQLDAVCYSRDLSLEKREELRQYLEQQGRTVRRDGMVWLRREHRDALISLRMGDGADE